MINILKQYNKIKDTKAFIYITRHFLFAIIFALLYVFCDRWMYYNKETAKKYGLGEINQLNNFWDYLYFSLITQTTVGYGGSLPGGGNEIKTKAIPLKILNFAQLIVLIIITGVALSGK